MKKKFFPVALTLLFVSIFSLTSVAQPTGSDGETEIQQPSPVSFKRVHGKGTCGTEGEMRVFFDKLPDQLPTLAEVRSNARAVAMVIGNMDASQFASKGYVSYCILSADNVTANKLSIRFHYDNPSRDYWVTEAHLFKN
jgi:hypothetical protein